MRTSRLLATVVTSATAVGAFVLAPATADAATTTGCRALPAWTQGRPAGFHPQAPAGDYIWHNDYGWHVRVTHRGTGRMVFTGVITTPAPMHVRLVKDERRDHVVLSSDRLRLAFRLVNHGAVDGFDFVESCAQTTKFSLFVNTHRTPLTRIDVGAASAHPTSNPFVIERAEPAPSDAPAGG